MKLRQLVSHLHLMHDDASAKKSSMVSSIVIMIDKERLQDRFDNDPQDICTTAIKLYEDAYAKFINTR